MTITSDTYIQNITDSGGDIMNEEFTINLPIENENEVIVWEVSTSTGVLTRIKRGEDYQILKVGDVWKLAYIGAAPHYNTATIRIQRHLLQTQPNFYNKDAQKVTPESIQKGFDETLKMIQQTVSTNTLDAKSWSLGNERISNLASSSNSANNAVTKKEVDDLIGGGTTPITVNSSDVGKWATADSSNGYAWSTFNGTPETRGQEYKYLTGEGWVDINNIVDIDGSGDNNKLLLDVNGTPVWTSRRHLPSESTTNLYNAEGIRPYGIVSTTHRGSTTIFQGSRPHRAAPSLLPNETGNRLRKKDEPAFGWGKDVQCENDWEVGTYITSHTVTCRSRPEGGSNASWYSGIGEKDDSSNYGMCDHPVYLGTFPNMYPNNACRVFLMSHLHVTPSSWLTAEGGNPATPLKFGYIFNIVSITSETITFVAASTLHEVETMTDPPPTGGGYKRHITHPEVNDIGFNCMWYLIK